MKPHLKAPGTGWLDPTKPPSDPSRAALPPVLPAPPAEESLPARLASRLLTRIRLPKAPDKSPLDRARAAARRSIPPSDPSVMNVMGTGRPQGGRRRR